MYSAGHGHVGGFIRRRISRGLRPLRGAHELRDRLAHAGVAHEAPVIQPGKGALLRPVELRDSSSALLCELVAVDDEGATGQTRHRDATLTFCAGEGRLEPRVDARRK